MKITSIKVFAKVDDPTQGFHVLVEDVGWLHIAKYPPSRDNIFFSMEELEMVAGCKLYLKEEIRLEDLDEKYRELVGRWSEM